MQKYFALLFLVFIPVSVFAFVAPEKPIGFVQDYAGLLNTTEVQNLENKLRLFEAQTGNEIAVVTIKSLDGDTIENVAQEIFTKWGIGKADKNNGVLLLISLGDRKTRIHTGYGVEDKLTDIGTSYIQQEVLTLAFRVEDYAGGINGAVDKIILALSGNEIVPEDYNTSGIQSGLDLEIIFFFGFFVLQLLLTIMARSKSWWFGGVIGGAIGALVWYFALVSFLPSIILFLLFVVFGLGFDYAVSNAYQKGKVSGHYPWWIGGGFGGGGHGGGFGGFGGGSSGGGGSSSSW